MDSGLAVSRRPGMTEQDIIRRFRHAHASEFCKDITLMKSEGAEMPGALVPACPQAQSKPPVCDLQTGGSRELGLAMRRLDLIVSPGLIVGRSRALAVLRHERVELFLVLGMAQAGQEFAEVALLFLKPPQRLHAVLVERAVAA
jgi:hypothetical protein